MEISQILLNDQSLHATIFGNRNELSEDETYIFANF